MNEASLTQGLVAELNGIANFIAFKLNDAKTAGIPDVALSGLGLTSWLEVKVGVIEGREIQRINMILLGLATGGAAFYILYNDQGTYVITPRQDTILAHSSKRRDHHFIVKWLIAYHKTRASQAN